jgi:hypothetical protein
MNEAASSKVKQFINYLGKETAAAICTTVVLAMAFMLFNDYISPPPDLGGRWMFTAHTKETSYAPYKNMQVTYQALIIQDNLQLRGTGEKLSAIGPGFDLEQYDGKARTNIRIEGSIKRNYFSRDELVIHFEEEGSKRSSSTLHQLEHFDPNMMCGCYLTTASDSGGSVWWQRVIDREQLVEADPLQKPAICNFSCK